MGRRYPTEQSIIRQYEALKPDLKQHFPNYYAHLRLHIERVFLGKYKEGIAALEMLSDLRQKCEDQNKDKLELQILDLYGAIEGYMAQKKWKIPKPTDSRQEGVSFLEPKFRKTRRQTLEQILAEAAAPTPAAVSTPSEKPLFACAK